MKLPPALLLGTFLLFGMAGCIDIFGDGAPAATGVEEINSGVGADGGDQPAATNDITLTGIMSAPAATSDTPAPAGSQARLDPSFYSLECLTFTDPMLSGGGAMGVDGSFSVTIAGAAGLPLGCFIHDDADLPVTGLTFWSGSGEAMDDGASSAVTLEGGSYDIALIFDPETALAQVDISSALAAGGVEAAGGFDPGLLSGEWSMACDYIDTESHAICSERILAGQARLPIYLDAISGEVNGVTRYAAGIWWNRAAFIQAGATEGLPNPTGEVRGLLSLNSDVSAVEDGMLPSAAGVFAGFAAAAGSELQFNEEAGAYLIGGEAALAALSAIGLPYHPTFNEPMLPAGTVDRCIEENLNMSLTHDRGCLIEYLESLEMIESGIATTVPRLDGRSHGSFGFPLDPATEQPADYDPELHKIHFRATRMGGALQPFGRRALMDLELNGNTAIMRQFRHDFYSRWDEDSSRPLPCRVIEELTIIAVITNEIAMNGWFDTRRSDSCRGGQSFASFRVAFTK